MNNEIINGIWDLIKPLIPIMSKFIILILAGLFLALIIVCIKRNKK